MNTESCRTQKQHRNPLHSHTDNEKSERGTEGTIPFTTATERIPRINLPKETEVLYANN